MAAPKRRGELGTEKSVLDDLLLARDTVGFARCGADRLQATLFLLYGGAEWSIDQVAEARQRLATETERSCSAFAVLHRGDACAQAAAASLRSILLQNPDDRATAALLRRRAREAHGCYLADDSLRKREMPIMQLIASKLYQALTTRQAELLPTKDSIFQVLKPYAELAAFSVENAAKLFSQRAALHDDDVLYVSVAHAMWAVSQFGVLPVYALQRLNMMGIHEVLDDAIVFLLDGLIHIPFTEEPDDLDQLATAIQLDESAENFYDRLLATPVMRPVVERFVMWLASHDPKTCLFDSNDVMVGYCSPHYYVALCEFFTDAADEYPSGEMRQELEGVLSAMYLREHARGHARERSWTLVEKDDVDPSSS